MINFHTQLFGYTHSVILISWKNGFWPWGSKKERKERKKQTKQQQQQQLKFLCMTSFKTKHSFFLVKSTSLLYKNILSILTLISEFELHTEQFKQFKAL